MVILTLLLQNTWCIDFSTFTQHKSEMEKKNIWGSMKILNFFKRNHENNLPHFIFLLLRVLLLTKCYLKDHVPEFKCPCIYCHWEGHGALGSPGKQCDFVNQSVTATRSLFLPTFCSFNTSKCFWTRTT